MDIHKRQLGNPEEFIEKLATEETKELFELDDILVKISLKIINYRINNSLTQKQLADKLEISQAMVSKLESGEYNPTIELLWKVSKKLGWKLDIILQEKAETQVWNTNEETILSNNQSFRELKKRKEIANEE